MGFHNASEVDESLLVFERDHVELWIQLALRAAWADRLVRIITLFRIKNTKFAWLTNDSLARYTLLNA